jgi:hypothetical protein
LHLRNLRQRHPHHERQDHCLSEIKRQRHDRTTHCVTVSHLDVERTGAVVDICEGCACISRWLSLRKTAVIRAQELQCLTPRNPEQPPTQGPRASEALTPTPRRYQHLLQNIAGLLFWNAKVHDKSIKVGAVATRKVRNIHHASV